MPPSPSSSIRKWDETLGIVGPCKQSIPLSIRAILGGESNLAASLSLPGMAVYTEH